MRHRNDKGHWGEERQIHAVPRHLPESGRSRLAQKLNSALRFNFPRENTKRIRETIYFYIFLHFPASKETKNSNNFIIKL